MKWHTLHVDNLRRIKYQAPTLSLACLFYATLFTVCALVPFILAYKSGLLWLKTTVYREQPLVRFSRLFRAHLFDLATPSTVHVHTDVEGVHELSVSSQDLNSDFIPDVLHLHLSLYRFNASSKSLSISGHFHLDMALVVKFALRQHCRYHGDYILYLSADIPSASFATSFIAQISLDQSFPLCYYGNQKHPVPTFRVEADQFRHRSLVDQLNAQALYSPVRLKLETPHTILHPDIEDNLVRVRVTLHITEQSVLYAPSVFQELKFAWVQYAAIALLFRYLFVYVKRWVFTNHVFAVWSSECDRT